VKNVSDLASEREVHEFFSFSGEIENIHIQRYYFFFCLCLLAEKMNETEKFWKTGSWVFGFLCYFSIVLVFLEWFFIFLVFETFCQEKMKESDFIILNLFLGLLVKIRKQVKLSYLLVIFA
jgi:hypothetical protein